MGLAANSKRTGRRIGRRGALVLVSGALVGGVATCSGLAVLATSGGKHEISFPEATYAAAGAGVGKVLVAYASQHGSTGGVADAIGQQLATGGLAVDVRQVKDVADLGSYSAAVVGSAIHGGKWMPEAMEFVQAHRGELSRMPTATFLVCMTLARDTEKNRGAASAFLNPVRELLSPVAEGLFAGAMYPANFPLLQAMGVAIYCLAVGGRSGDHRDWGAIRAWADGTRPLLLRP